MLQHRIKHRNVKFSPEEMAYDPSPEETKDWVFLGRGPDAIFLKSSDARVATLDPDVAVFFTDDRMVNRILRNAKSLIQDNMKLSTKKRRIA